MAFGLTFPMNSKQRRDCKRLSLKTQLYELAIALLLSLSPPLHALVQLGSIKVKVVNFFSKKDLIEKGVDVTGSSFSNFDDFSVLGNKWNINPDNIFHYPTIVFSVTEISTAFPSAKLEVIYLPDWSDRVSTSESDLDVLSYIRFVSYSLPESAYRKKQGSSSINSYLIPY